MKHLLKLIDLSTEEILGLLDLADDLKAKLKSKTPHKYLEGMSLGMIFQKSSTRTRVSFETGMYQLGGQALFLSSKDLQIGRGESIEDTARVLSRYLDGIMIRTYEQQEVEAFAKHGSIPIINGLTDFAHPCQVLADLMTIREYKGQLDGLKMCYIGDCYNMANSLIVGGLKTGMEVAIAAPRGYELHPTIQTFAKAYDGFSFTHDILAAAKDADVLITDVWASMGQDDILKRKQDFKGFCIDQKVMDAAKPGAMVQHCLPAHKGEEITREVFDAHAAEIFDEAENRLHAQKAVLVELLGTH